MDEYQRRECQRAYAPGTLSATTYYRRTVTACGAASSAATTALTVTVNQPPVITTQPANPAACVGGSTSVNVVATGTALTYQWQVYNGSSWSNAVNGAVYSGVTTSTLAISNVTAGMNNYQYRVIISGSCPAPVTSNQVILTTGIAPVIGTQPANTTTCVGSTTTIGLVASGSGLTYQWQQKIGAGAWTNLTDGGYLQWQPDDGTDTHRRYRRHEQLFLPVYREHQLRWHGHFFGRGVDGCCCHQQYDHCGSDCLYGA